MFQNLNVSQSCSVVILTAGKIPDAISSKQENIFEAIKRHPSKKSRYHKKIVASNYEMDNDIMINWSLQKITEWKQEASQ